MEPYGKSNDILKIILILLLLSGQSGDRRPAGGTHFTTPFRAFSPGALPLPPIPLDSFSRDMHRIVDMMDQISGLGQIAALPIRSDPPGHSHITGAAESISRALSSSLPSSSIPAGGPPNLPDLQNVPDLQNLPDLQKLMEMAGPLLSTMMNGQKK